MKSKSKFKPNKEDTSRRTPPSKSQQRRFSSNVQEDSRYMFQRVVGNQAVQSAVETIRKSTGKTGREIDKEPERQGSISGVKDKQAEDGSSPVHSEQSCPRCVHRYLAGKPLHCTECEETLLQSTHKPQIRETGRTEGTQPKLEISAPEDKSEREAERVATEVIQMSDPSPAANSQEEVPPGKNSHTKQNIHSLRGTGRPLPESVRIYFEPRFGYDFSNVRIHTGARADEMAQTINAEAFTVGRDLFFQSGTYHPKTDSGKQLLAHELTHVVQQETNDNTNGLQPQLHRKQSNRSSATQTTLRWQHVKRHRWDALWYFCGEHPQKGFSTTATLRAEGYTNPDNVEWFVRQGADKVFAPDGFKGPEITLHSSAGSSRPGDVQIEAQERMPDGTVNSYLGDITVRKPHRLRREWTSDVDSPCPPTSRGFKTRIAYRVIDNVGGTMIGATVNQRFPDTPVDDQPNNWTRALGTTGDSWPETDGIFVDNIHICAGPATNPLPVVSSDRSEWLDKVFHMTQEFYVGSTTPGQGCRVQRHTLQYYRGFAEHENIRSPAP